MISLILCWFSGNGPSGICLSYLLSGNWPHFTGEPHPNPILQLKLEGNEDQSILECVSINQGVYITLYMVSCYLASNFQYLLYLFLSFVICFCFCFCFQLCSVLYIYIQTKCTSLTFSFCCLLWAIFLCRLTQVIFFKAQFEHPRAKLPALPFSSKKPHS